VIYNSANGVVIIIVILVAIAAGVLGWIFLWLGGDK